MYHYSQDRNGKADFVVDIAKYFEQKMEVILCYESQFHPVANSAAYADQPQTPISGKDFMDYQRHKAAAYGREAGFELAEAFNVNRVIGVKDLFSLT
ncbi:MAG: hypothetical protein AAFU03_04905 [Bacteroidota bacterium]